MRAREFITEQATLPLTAEISKVLSNTYTIPGLPNSDFYKQYRFGVAMAGAKGARQRETDNIQPYPKSTEWGENMVVSSHMDPDLEQDIDYAMKQVGVTGKKLISTLHSEEPDSVSKSSPVRAFKGYPK